MQQEVEKFLFIQNFYFCKKSFHGNFFEDTVPPALTTGMLKFLVITYFEQANGREW